MSSKFKPSGAFLLCLPDGGHTTMEGALFLGGSVFYARQKIRQQFCICSMSPSRLRAWAESPATAREAALMAAAV